SKCCGRSHICPDTGCGNHIVPTRMTYLRQGIIFRHDDDAGMLTGIKPRGLHGGFKSCVHTVNPELYLVAMVAQYRGENLLRTYLFKSKLWVCMQIFDDEPKIFFKIFYLLIHCFPRSEERRVGKQCMSRR